MSEAVIEDEAVREFGSDGESEFGVEAVRRPAFWACQHSEVAFPMVLEGWGVVRFPLV